MIDESTRDDTKGHNNRHEKAHPFIGWLVLFAMAFSALGLTYVVAYYWIANDYKFGPNTFHIGKTIIDVSSGQENLDPTVFNVRWWALTIPVLLFFTGVIRIIDAFLKGKLTEYTGFLIGIGFPTFGHSLKRLAIWYNESNQKAMIDGYQKAGIGQKEELQGRHPFSQWMIEEVIPKYENNVQAMAYWGAAILIVFVGMRGIQLLTKNDPSLLVFSFFLEFSLLGLLGLLLFFKPERNEHNGRVEPDELGRLERELGESKQTIQSFMAEFEKYKQKVDGFANTRRAH